MSKLKFTLKEMCYLVAVFGDIPLHQRKRLFGLSSCPVHAGYAVVQAGHDLVRQLNISQIEPPVRRRRRRSYVSRL